MVLEIDVAGRMPLGEMSLKTTSRFGEDDIGRSKKLGECRDALMDLRLVMLGGRW